MNVYLVNSGPGGPESWRLLFFFFSCVLASASRARSFLRRSFLHVAKGAEGVPFPATPPRRPTAWRALTLPAGSGKVYSCGGKACGAWA